MWQIDFKNIIMLIGVSQGFFLVILLLFRSIKARSSIILATYVLLMSLYILDILLLNNGLILSLFGFNYLTDLFNMLYGVLIFIYTRSQIEERLRLKKYDLLFIIPIVAYFVYYIAIYRPEHDEVQYVINNGIFYSEHIWEWGFEVFINSSFYIASFIMLRNVNKNNELQSKYKAVTNVILICIASVIVDIVLILLVVIGVPCADICNNIIVTMFILILLTFGYNEFITTTTHAKDKRKLLQSPTQSVDISDIAERLIVRIERDKVYLDSKLTLKDLAESIGVQPQTLSQIINGKFGKNYSDFINSYRIDEAKKLLKDPDFKNFTITAIGFEAGFNSKSAFYEAFKKHTGKTPAKHL